MQPDWLALKTGPAEGAAEALRYLVEQMKGVEEYTFAVRGWAFRIYEGRELYKLDIDPRVDLPYASMNSWLEGEYPKHARYYKEAWAAAKALQDIPFNDFAAMPRVNIKLLEKASSGLSKMPDVVEAAKTMPEKEFRAKLNIEHHQHIEEFETLKLTYPAGDMASVKTYLSRKAGLLELAPDDYTGALLAIAIDDNMEVEDADAQ